MKEDEKPISGYDFSLKKDKIKELFNTPEYQDFKKKQKKTQARKETAYKFTSIGNSTNIVRNLIIVNAAFFLLQMLFPTITTMFACYNVWSPEFMPWQPLTSMFLHGGFIHLALNMFVLWSFGNQLDQIIGTKKFLSLYFISGLVGGILWMFLGIGPAVGASGALCGLMAAYVFIAPDAEVLLFFIIPVKIKNAVYGFAAFSLVFGVLSMFNPALGFGIGHFAHLGGLIGGYLITYYWKTKNLIPTA